MYGLASRSLSKNKALSTSFRYFGQSSARLQNVGGVAMPTCDFVPDKYEGISYEKALEIRKSHLAPGLLTFYKKPLMVNQGHKQWLYDIEGRRYLDQFAGIVTVGVGHCHPKVEDAVFKQMRKLWHTTNIYLHSPIHEYAEKLVSKLPDPLKVCVFVNSGTEANELAMNMMRLYTGNHDIICLRNSYHGTGSATLGVLSQSHWKYQLPSAMGYHPTSNPDVYRGAWGGSNCRDSPVQCVDRPCACKPGECAASNAYLGQLQEIFDYNVPKKIAGFMAEPIQGVGGSVQYPTTYMKEAYKKVREHGGLCLSDEVQTGFGRLGSHFWGFEAMGVVPDIVTVAKSVANGFPMGAVITTPEIAAVMAQAVTFNTYGGNPMACSAASTVLDVIEEEKLQANCEKVGTHYLNELSKLRDQFDIVGDVRGKGLMIGVEMVDDKISKTPLAADRMLDIWERTKDYGVLFGKGGRFGNVFRIQPPMCMTKEDTDFAVAVLKQSIIDHQNDQA